MLMDPRTAKEWWDRVSFYNHFIIKNTNNILSWPTPQKAYKVPEDNFYLHSIITIWQQLKLCSSTDFICLLHSLMGANFTLYL